MKATGIVRRIDDVGRIVIPKEIRQEYKISEGMPFEIYLLENRGGVLFKPYDNSNDIVKSAENFLRVEKSRIESMQAVFKIENTTTTCELFNYGKRRTGKAKLQANDTFNPSVGMAISFMKACDMNPEELNCY